jgi:hypothetical protein
MSKNNTNNSGAANIRTGGGLSPPLDVWGGDQLQTNHYGRKIPKPKYLHF